MFILICIVLVCFNFHVCYFHSWFLRVLYLKSAEERSTVKNSAICFLTQLSKTKTQKSLHFCSQSILDFEMLLIVFFNFMTPLLLFSLYNLQPYLQEFCSKSVVETRSYRHNSYLAKIRRKPAWNIFVHRYSPSAFSRFINPIFAKLGGCRCFLFKKSGDFNLNREILKSWK